MNIPDNCHYTESHEWVRLEGKEALIGITDFAQSELGDVVYIELPEIDFELSAGEECGMIDSAKTTSPLVSPISGTVARINDDLADHPEYINQSPYEDGWMYALEPTDMSEFDELMDAKAYKNYLKESGH